MQKTYNLTIEKKVALLKQTPLFAGIKNNNDYRELAQLFTVADFRPGDILIHQDKSAGFALLICEGTAQVFHTAKSKVQSAVALVGPGDLVGEFSLLDGGKASATVEAISSVHALQISNQDLMQFLLVHCELTIELLQMLVRRLRAADQVIEESHGATLATRTLKVLEHLVQLQESNTIRISHAELAPLVNASRPRLTEALQSLEREGNIIRSWRKITWIHSRPPQSK